MAEGAEASQSEAPLDLGTDETPHPWGPCLSSLPFSSLWRYYLRQEPYEVIPQVRICAGGRQATDVPTAT